MLKDPININNVVCATLGVKYEELFEDRPSTELYPKNWDVIKDSTIKAEIIKEAIDTKKLIEETIKYQNLTTETYTGTK